MKKLLKIKESKQVISIDKIDVRKDFNAIRVRLASPELIKQWSKGEVKKPETINYRTFKPEKDGLFCEKIFGPTKDWECYCGKYKRIKHKEVVCDRCGVQVTVSKVRRERMGHIELATPVSHIWFLKTVPSRMGVLLDIPVRDLERVVYYESYIVVDPGNTPLTKKQILNEEEYQKAQAEHGTAFKAKMGADAIKDLLKEFNLELLAKSLRDEMKKVESVQRKKEVIKRLKIVDAFRRSGNKPEWIILDVIPVLPPDLRPLVPLDGGRFATSDLNDLYRRVINRNNRLKRLIELKAPDIILNNEKRMLQEAVDALFDNGRRGHPIKGQGNRPLKSLSDMLKGKQGRFRQNLLGKRVDYSGRSVIVVGPELKLHQCGLPKKMALELFKPFVIKKLEDRGFVHTVKSAKRMVEKVKPEVWEVLEEVIQEHPILLNRAPTLHRQGVQAFEPILIEGKALRIHPLVCTAFNADFDGDQMAVHIPLSPEAIAEARLLMLATNNIFSTSNGKPLVVPSQDIVLGCYYLTKMKDGCKGEGKIFTSIDEAVMAYYHKVVDLHAKVKIRCKDKIIDTAVGRIIFNSILPEKLRFVNSEMNKKALSQLVENCFKNLGNYATINLLDAVKETGFKYATLAGITVSIDDMKIPFRKKEFITEAWKDVEDIESQYKKGIITMGERYNKIIDLWTHVTDRVADAMLKELAEDKKGFNPVFMMVDSGSRGSKQQIRQLAGMRGLMAKPQQRISGQMGEIIEQPIIANFREGLTVLEYFISTHGARKGLADTALKTADAGYLTRRLVDVAQDIIITEDNCGTLNGITIGAIKEGADIMEPLRDRIIGRFAVDNVADILTDEILIKANEEITEEKASKIEEAGIEKIRIRSVLTCESKWGVCAKCYGWDLGKKRLVNLGEAVGIIAAQSIGEPGTQLTLRTFHIGGTAARVIEQSKIQSKFGGVVRYHNLRVIKNRMNELIVLNRNGEITIHDETGKEREIYLIPYGAVLLVDDGQKVKKNDAISKWDLYTIPIFTEFGGKLKFTDIVEGRTMREEVDLTTNLVARVIIEHKEEHLHPRIKIVNKSGTELMSYSIATGAMLSVTDGDQVLPGDIIAKIPREISKTRDITGGLPRVAELFEARKPKDYATITEIDGIVNIGSITKGMLQIIVKHDGGVEKEYLVPQGKHLNVYDGDRVKAGDVLTDGSINPHDILRVKGEYAAQEYLVEKVQEVYKLQGVTVNDKHIEVIVRQMLRNIRIEDSGDTEFLIDQQVDKIIFNDENEKMLKKKKKPAIAKPMLLGITKAALSTESYISAASFQETTRVLTEAAISGKMDELRGLKENVIMGHLIPAGTGISRYRNISIADDVIKILEEEANEEKIVESR